MGCRIGGPPTLGALQSRSDGGQNRTKNIGESTGQVFQEIRYRNLAVSVVNTVEIFDQVEESRNIGRGTMITDGTDSSRKQVLRVEL